MTDQPTPYRYVDEDGFCLSARLLPDLDTGGVTETLSITIEGSDEPQSVHVRAADAPAIAAGIVRAAGQPAAGVAPVADQTDNAELTAEEARDLVAELGLDLYRAQDALAFVGECCDIADREGRPITTADLREWLKGDRCTRQRAADAADQTGLRDRIADALARHYDGQHLAELREEHAAHHTEAADAVLAVLPDQQAAIRAAALQEAADWFEGQTTTRFYGHQVATQLRRMGAGAQQQGGTEARCTCADAGDCFAPAEHYADCPQAGAQQQPAAAGEEQA